MRTCARTRLRARARVCARRRAGARELRAGNAAAIPRQSLPNLIKKVRCGSPYVLESDPMLPTPLVLTILTIKLGSVIADLHKPELPRVGLPTQALSELGSVFTDQDEAYATNTLRQPHPRRQKCAQSLVPAKTFFSSWGRKDPYE